MEKRFDVVIKECKTGKIVSTIGKNLSETNAEKRTLTGLSRINKDYFIDTILIKEA